MTSEVNDLYRIELIDLLGRIILTGEFENEFTLENQGWPEGMYMARIVNSDNKQLTGKLYISN